ncbi:MAG TPA: hypothetical protein PK573_03780 [Spirochaetota bacterium]|nr:hypothetical protein [Spirochaetota bacterium]HRZ26963.1 hypothetical protein [Spirochaetota bacterium]HSA15976.1 hypothetical protein [Spirochaetota bacterium]
MKKAIIGLFVLCGLLPFLFGCDDSGGGGSKAGSIDKKYFSANAGGTVGYSLWVTDGTTDGTKLVKDIDETSLGNGPYGFTAMGGKTYFSTTDGSTGYELWVTDGTDTGTHIVKNIDGGAGHGVADAGTGYWAVMNGRLYFSADDGSTGNELWVSNGTESGTVRVKDINPDAGDSDPYELTVMNGLLYFYANDGTNGAELWVSDGTDGGTTRLTDINPTGNSSPALLTPIGNRLYFRANDGGSSYGHALWVYDADLNDLSLVKDPNETVNVPNYWVLTEMVSMDGVIYFAGENITDNSELWRSEGTEETTDILTEIREGDTGSAPQDLAAIDGKIYFCATNGTSGQDLWISDGTALGTYGIDIADEPTSDPSYPEYFTEYNGLVYFKAQDSTGRYELWVTDGTAQNTHVVKIIEPTVGSAPKYLTVLNNKLLFVAFTEAEGVELWSTDGTEDGTTILKDINPGDADGNPYIE